MRTFGKTGTKTARVLAIETSTKLLGVAVVDNTGIRCELTIVEPRIHSKMLLPLCMQAMDIVGLAPGDLDCLAVSGGPGSFTGLRIGFATVQGLAFSLDKPVAKVPTFQVYLRQCSAYPRVGIVQGKARSQTVCALYEKVSEHKEAWETASGPGFWTEYGFNETVPAGAMAYNQFLNDLGDKALMPVWVTGDAAEQFSGVAVEAGTYDVRVVDSHLRLPGPGVLGLIGLEMFLEGKVVCASSAVPEYYRRSQAEVVFARKRMKGDSVEHP
ncbi:MAG TPA: tRNA (adenosine(37)-N6)-threonylcarbamoyltransferase complex dimerization subunit type 1 TsaB [Firmicutes bacterium]|nr:tRNA (adenosine(37)-N6)-threonylcarbamoyltransferase complex dimerization subunit type 1 TsaB [Candidatus Fermentithermobacillaceae bacterium]